MHKPLRGIDGRTAEPAFLGDLPQQVRQMTYLRFAYGARRSTSRHQATRTWHGARPQGSNRSCALRAERPRRSHRRPGTEARQPQANFPRRAPGTARHSVSARKRMPRKPSVAVLDTLMAGIAHKAAAHLPAPSSLGFVVRTFAQKNPILLTLLCVPRHLYH